MSLHVKLVEISGRHYVKELFPDSTLTDRVSQTSELNSSTLFKVYFSKAASFLVHASAALTTRFVQASSFGHILSLPPLIIKK